MSWGQLSRRQKIAGALGALAANPARVLRAVPGELAQSRRRLQVARSGAAQALYEVDEGWDEHLHALLGAPWPCPQAAALDPVLADIDTLRTARGLGSGRLTYGWYSDAERSLCRAAWCITTHTRPQTVIETGVAHGVTSRVVLEALARNDTGHLHSIDLPFPFDRRVHAETGALVTGPCRARWSYLAGPSSRLLPPLTAEAGPIALFIHDSLHTADNVLFEMEQAATAMTPGGIMLIDDIGESGDGFATFHQRHPHYQTLICPASDRRGPWGIFGIAINTR